MTAHPLRQFASDTWAGVCPEAIGALHEANSGHVNAYGDDHWTDRATAALRELFETDCAAFFVPTGTAANALALAGLCQSYHSVFCHTEAHIQTDECGAPEYASKGIKLIPLEGSHGMLASLAIQKAAAQGRGVHSHKPGVLSLSLATEAGTLYSVDEIGALGQVARELGLRVHIDGARFANALATLKTPPKAITWQAGVDVLCFGGTKNGLAAADVIIFFNRDLANGFEYRRKQAGHLIAKMRFLTAPWASVLESGAWLRHARHANAMARLLADAVRGFPGMSVVHPVQANAVFVEMPRQTVAGMHRRGWHFYNIAGGERLMCSWDTQPADIDAFVNDLRALTPEGPPP